jgi:dimethylamine/trimethylamine dehydrogenase
MLGVWVRSPGGAIASSGDEAAGGFAIVHTEWCAIHPEADEWPAITAKIWDDDDARNLQLMVERVHEHQALAGIQLGFNGSGSNNLDTRIGARGVEQVSTTRSPSTLLRHDEAEIRELQQFYAAGAERASRGLRRVNCVNEAPVSAQFLMPRYNHRTEAGGRSRIRILAEVPSDERPFNGLCAERFPGSRPDR